MFPKDCQHGYLEHAEELAKLVKYVPNDEELDPSLPFPLFIAQLRHQQTNYDEVLYDLDLHCMNCVETNGACPLDVEGMEEISHYAYMAVKQAHGERRLKPRVSTKG